MNCPWEKISQFASPRELNRFLEWMGSQIAEGAADEIDAPAERQVIMGERWFRHIPSGTRWRLVPAEAHWPLAFGRSKIRTLKFSCVPMMDWSESSEISMG